MSSNQSPILKRGGFALVYDQVSHLQHTDLRLCFNRGSLSDASGTGAWGIYTGLLLRGDRSSRSYLEWAETWESLGATVDLKVDLNRTQLRVRCLSESTEEVLSRILESLFSPAFRESDFEILKEIALSEFRQSLEDPFELAQREVQKRLWAGTLAENGPDGTLRSLSELTYADVLKIHDSSESIALRNVDCLVAGVSSFTEQRVEKILERFLGDRVAPEEVAFREYPLPTYKRSSVDQFERPTLFCVESPEAETTPFYWVTPAPKESDSNRLAIEVGQFVLGGEFTSRLVQEIRVKRGWSYGAGSSLDYWVSTQPNQSLLSVSAFPSSEFSFEALKKSLEIMRSWAREGITSAEFQSALRAMIRSYPFQWVSAQQRILLKMQSILTRRTLLSVQEFEDQLNCLTLDQVNASLNQHFSNPPFLMGTVVGDPLRFEANSDHPEAPWSAVRVEVLEEWSGDEE